MWFDKFLKLFVGGGTFAHPGFFEGDLVWTNIGLLWIIVSFVLVLGR